MPMRSIPMGERAARQQRGDPDPEEGAPHRSQPVSISPAIVCSSKAKAKTRLIREQSRAGKTPPFVGHAVRHDTIPATSATTSSAQATMAAIGRCELHCEYGT